MKHFAIIPVKAKSTRVLNKNFRVLKDKPLWKWTLDKLIETKLFDKIFLSSDMIESFNISNYKNVILHNRSKKLCTGNIHAIEVVFDVLKKNKGLISENDNIMMMLVTSPFRSSDSIKDSCKMIENGANSVIGIHKASKGSNSYRTFKKGTSFLKIPKKSKLHLQSTDLDEYVVTGSIFASTYRNLVKYKTFHQPNSEGILVPDEESIDINTEIDFLTAEVFANRYL